MTTEGISSRKYPRIHNRVRKPEVRPGFRLIPVRHKEKNTIIGWKEIRIGSPGESHPEINVPPEAQEGEKKISPMYPTTKSPREHVPMGGAKDD